MNALKLADDLNNANGFQYIAQLGLASQAATMLRKQAEEIEALNQRIERMIENASHHEGIAHAGGFETGYQAGLKKAQEK